jgi:hypothetical protein
MLRVTGWGLARLFRPRRVLPRAVARKFSAAGEVISESLDPNT